MRRWSPRFKPRQRTSQRRFKIRSNTRGRSGASHAKRSPGPAWRTSGRGFLSTKRGWSCGFHPKVILAHLGRAPMRGDEMPRLQTRSPALRTPGFRNLQGARQGSQEGRGDFSAALI
jgi:hypothetical protein